ncbi:type ISP restriction/modification enzyme [Streptomyces sp. NPDC051940]|uniref:type ISP restriction/modification enzyme n=1 Tax=Streptomyces sp. NPDC051940 TaxID=3155675 RepID=UPI003449F1ED
MPWGVAPLRLGRPWIMAPDPDSLRARWARLLAAEGPAREALFHPTRSRTPTRSVGQLPGQRTGTGRLARETAACPDPIPVLHGAFDRQWLIPDHRLIDQARPELWRVADERQMYAVELGPLPGGPPLVASDVLPDGRSPAGRPGRIRPLYRRPGGREPNLAPGLVEFLTRRLGVSVAPEDVLAWALAVARAGTQGCEVPLTADPLEWAAGLERGHRLLDLQLRGARSGTRPRLPGGRRPYVRAALPARPRELAYDEEDEALLVDEGRVSPVPKEAWEFEAAGVRVLQLWFERRTVEAEPGSLEALRPREWPQAWTSELLELVTVLALMADAPPAPEVAAPVRPAELREAGVLPVPGWARRPASVFDHHEEGPEGQFALI